ncbi:SDR family NAD(P)-dependent oxidoreductase [Staphylococcus simulans]|uniref:SDR family NAD(P)-dependent oxidoreductase n=1 Tax=Staphylococcus simulans TaxID=1286 RepID=UPI000D1F00DC|nr:SDR family oxidoreductase [Staphylococcus simulans]MDY5060720.1 SDR family oxidoreductase [Staphylococcus simulans]PTJ20556.1 SDR family oxidoreductase [Staphylococcus simulans]
MGKLDNKVAIITGGSSGLGEAVAKRFAAEGAKVVIVNRHKEKGEKVLKAIEDNGGTGLALGVDVTSKNSVEEAVKTIKDQFGTIDILYNGAGVHDGYKDALETDEDTFDLLMGVNVKGAYLFTHAVLPTFLDNNSGVIINVGSQGSSMAGVGGSTYVTTKHAIAGFTKQLAYDFGHKGIRANLLSPGFIETPMTEGVDEQRTKEIPAQRAGKPEDLAAAAVFLASDEAAYVQGAELNVDGGWTVGR